MLKGFLISIVVLAVMCLGGFIVYNVAYARGETAGYDEGYASGQDVGYTSGTQEGYDEGYNVGKADGYDEGVAAGLGHGYTLRDPTYQEAVLFIAQDRTDENTYVEGTYECRHFATDVCNNAEGKGLRCAYVWLGFPEEMGHTIVAFDTIDKGLVYFEPQTDMIAKPVIGKLWYQCQEPPPGYSGYEPPSYDDTIKDILVIW